MTVESPTWIDDRSRLKGRAKARQLRLDVERHRGHAAQCIHAAWFWRQQPFDHAESAFKSVIIRARQHSRAAQAALREIRKGDSNA